MADQSSPPGHTTGSDDVSESFHPAHEWLLHAGDDEDEEDSDYDPETDLTNPMLYFDADEGDEDEEDEDDDDDDDEEEEDSQDDETAAATEVYRKSLMFIV